jgi:hypothetical protein
MRLEVRGFITDSNEKMYNEYLAVKNFFYTSKGNTDSYKNSNDWNQGEKLCDHAIALCENIIQESGTLVCSQNKDKELLAELRENVTKVSDMLEREKELSQLNRTSAVFQKRAFDIGSISVSMICLSFWVKPIRVPFPTSLFFIGCFGLGATSLGRFVAKAYPKLKFLRNTMNNVEALLIIKNIELAKRVDLLKQAANT